MCYWLLFQRTQVQFPEPTQGLKNSNSSSRRSDALLWPPRELHEQQQINTSKTPIRKEKNIKLHMLIQKQGPQNYSTEIFKSFS